MEDLVFISRSTADKPAAEDCLRRAPAIHPAHNGRNNFQPLRIRAKWEEPEA